MRDSDKLAIAAHLHVVMRRKVGRVTDVEWLLRSPEYAREIIRLALAETAHPELVDWAQRLQAALFPPPPQKARISLDRVPPRRHAEEAQASPLDRYVVSLR